jgi:hypothetical protein
MTDPVGMGFPVPPLTAAATSNACSEVMLFEEGVTVTVGVVLAAAVTVSETEALAVVKSFVSAGVNVTESVCDPIAGTVPGAGEYAKVPSVLAMASSWVALSAVP